MVLIKKSLSLIVMVVSFVITFKIGLSLVLKFGHLYYFLGCSYHMVKFVLEA
jgi:hypothetical protein